jgi:hypothetical protein
MKHLGQAILGSQGLARLLDFAVPGLDDVAGARGKEAYERPSPVGRA